MPARTDNRCAWPSLAPTASALALLGVSFAYMGNTTRRTITGAGLGRANGALASSLTGDAGWGALLRAGVGSTSGYPHERNQRCQEDGSRRGLQDGRHDRH